MVKRTVPELVEFVTEATGLSDSNLRTISRRLRESDMLSQFGHGRGAAAATAEDAAGLLLVAATEFPPLHAVIVGWALWACRPVLEYPDEETTRAVLEEAEPFKVDGDFPKNPILLVASLIKRRVKIDEINLWLAKGLSVNFVNCRTGEFALTEGGISYTLHSDGTVASAFEEKLGGRLKLRRQHIIDGQVLLDIHDWLHLAEDEEEASAA